MKVLFANRYVEAFVRTVSFFGLTHLVILTSLAIRKDVQVLNAFNILDLDSYLPGLGSGVYNFILSYCMVFVVYAISFFYFTKSENKKESFNNDI
jgi:hypothetical protein